MLALSHQIRQVRTLDASIFVPQGQVSTSVRGPAMSILCASHKGCLLVRCDARTQDRAMSSLCFTTRHLHGHLPPRTRGVPRGMRLRATRLRLEHGPERGWPEVVRPARSGHWPSRLCGPCAAADGMRAARRLSSGSRRVRGPARGRPHGARSGPRTAPLRSGSRPFRPWPDYGYHGSAHGRSTCPGA